MIISINTLQVFDENQHISKINTFSKLGLNFLYYTINMMNFINFHFSSGIRQQCPILPVLFNIVWGGSVQCYKMRKGKVIMFKTEKQTVNIQRLYDCIC